MKRLFNEFTAQTKEANEISNRVETMLYSIVGNYPDVDLNDLEAVIVRTITAEMAVLRATFAAKLRNEKRNNGL